MRLPRPRLLLAVCAAGVLTVAACGASGDDEPAAAPETPATEAPAKPAAAPAEPTQTLDFVARDYSFEGPTTATAGLTELTLDNAGVEDHQLGLFKLNEGVEAGAALAALGAAGHLEAGREFGEWLPGPNGVGPNGSVSVVTELEPGTYIVGCLIPAPDGTPHAMKGMLSQLTVAPSADPAAEPASSADLPVVSLQDYHFELPDGIGTGPVIVRNDGDDVHEFVVVRLADGATVQDVIAYEGATTKTSPPPSTMVTGTAFLDPGREGRLDLELEPGDYAAICFIPSPTGEAHAQLGMVHPFTV